MKRYELILRTDRKGIKKLFSKSLWIWDFPKSAKESIKREKEIFEKKGVYLLINKVEKNVSDPNDVYVGQGDNVVKRLFMHKDDEIKHNRVVIIYHSVDHFLSNDRRLYIEDLFIKHFKARPKVWNNEKNKNSNRKKLGADDETELKEDFDFMLYGLYILEYPIYNCHDQKSIPNYNGSKGIFSNDKDEEPGFDVFISQNGISTNGGVAQPEQGQRIFANFVPNKNQSSNKGKIKFQKEETFITTPKGDKKEFIEKLRQKEVKGDIIWKDNPFDNEIAITINKNKSFDPSPICELITGGTSCRGPMYWFKKEKNLKTNRYDSLLDLGYYGKRREKNK